MAVYEEAVKPGVHIFLDQRMPGSEEIFFKYASDEQLEITIHGDLFYKDGKTVIS